MTGSDSDSEPFEAKFDKLMVSGFDRSRALLVKAGRTLVDSRPAETILETETALYKIVEHDSRDIGALRLAVAEAGAESFAKNKNFAVHVYGNEAAIRRELEKNEQRTYHEAKGLRVVIAASPMQIENSIAFVEQTTSSSRKEATRTRGIVPHSTMNGVAVTWRERAVVAVNVIFQITALLVMSVAWSDDHRWFDAVGTAAVSCCTLVYAANAIPRHARRRDRITTRRIADSVFYLAVFANAVAHWFVKPDIGLEIFCEALAMFAIATLVETVSERRNPPKFRSASGRERAREVSQAVGIFVVVSFALVFLDQWVNHHHAFDGICALILAAAVPCTITDAYVFHGMSRNRNIVKIVGERLFTAVMIALLARRWSENHEILSAIFVILWVYVFFIRPTITLIRERSSSIPKAS